jgi:hypothetical protein
MIMSPREIEAIYPGKRLIHLLVDNIRYHHARLVQAWLAAGMPDQAAFHPHLLPTPGSD